ncbi:hypothetical protein Tco_0385816, partial [Tanacetum coccineum]
KSPPLLALVQDLIHQTAYQPGPQEKVKAIKARLNFEEASQHSESGTPSRRKDLKKRLGSRHVRSMSRSLEPRRGHSESPKKRDPKRKTVFKRIEKGVFHRLGDKGKGISAYSNNSRLVTSRHTTKESIDSYDDLKKAFLENYLQQKKCFKNPVEIHNIKQRDGESTEEFVRRRSHFRHGNSKKLDRSKTSKREAFGTKKGQSEGEEDGTEGPMIIEAEMGGHFVHCMYVDGGSSSKILKISLLGKIGDEEHSTSTWINFMVVRSPSPYNGIIGRQGVRRIKAVPSTAHEMLKFLMTGISVTLRSSKIIPLECTMVSGPGVPQPIINQVTKEKIQVPRHISEHRLNILKGCLPVRQKKRGQAPERNKAIYEEVEKLVDAGIMKEVHYHSWLSNPVMVKKHDGKWRVCVDFKDLDKACPKDGYSLPKIDWKVESLCGYPFKCFLDAYKGYHQIKMAKEDKEKTAFITSQGILCYLKMSFGIKNARATYQCLVDKAF